MRRRLLLLGVVAALAGCSGDDEKGPPAAATAPQVTVTETVARGAPAASTEPEKGKPRKEKRISEATPEEPVGKKQAAPDSKSGSGVPAGQVQATNGSPPEVTLAVIDAESAYVKKSAVARYAGLLDGLEADCTEARTQLAESALTASHDVTTETASKLSILAVLREVAADRPSGQCIPAFERVAQRHGA